MSKENTPAKTPNSEVMTLRAHHVCCLRFWKSTFEERGEAFSQALSRIKKVLLSHPDVPVLVAEGPDDLCAQCKYLYEGRCISPMGNENEVRKWDAVLMRELALPFNCCLTAREWQELISKKVPFKLCRQCQWRHECSMGEVVS